jgi:hypothetical protein
MTSLIGIIFLTWLGIVNKGLLPISFLLAATAWALVEQIISGFIVSRTMKTQKLLGEEI